MVAESPVSKWFRENDVTDYKFRCYIGHKEYDTSYGELFDTDKGMVFIKHKHVEINANAPAPKVCSMLTLSCRFVDEAIFNTFVEIDRHEFIVRDVTSMREA